MQIEYVLLIIAAVGALVSVIFNNLQGRVKELERGTQSDGVRIQKIEDVQGNKLDNMSLELKEFQVEVRLKLEALAAMIHRDTNQEQQLNSTLSLLLKRLTEGHE